MRLKALPFTPIVGVQSGSDIESLFSSSDGLAITVAREIDESGNIQGLKILFDQASAFRLLDEVDLARYWISEGFRKGSHILEVLEGGWADEESQLQGYETQRREWLIVTGNSCVSVFSSSEPQVQTVTWQRTV